MHEKEIITKHFKLYYDHHRQGISFNLSCEIGDATPFDFYKEAFEYFFEYKGGIIVSQINEFKMFPASAHMSDQDIDDWYNAWKEQLVLEKEIKLPSDGQNGEKNQEKPQKKGRL